MVPRAVLMKTSLKPFTTAKTVNTAHPKSIVISAKPMSCFPKTAQSTVRRPFQSKIALSNKRFTHKVNTSKAQAVNTARPQAVNTARLKTVKTARPNSAVVNVVRVKQANAVKALACWVWRPTKPNSAPITLKKHNCIDARGRSKSIMDWWMLKAHDWEHITYLSDFKEFDGGYVTFGGGAHGGRISGKGTLKTDSLDFEDVYFVNELKFNLFSVSQMCDKKNYVLFTDTECLVLSPNFKLPDESQILLKIPRKDNMYSFDMKNIVPKESLTCLVAKATLDESMLWHRRLGHINFKNINKLVKDNLVRGLPTKRFENDQTCVACLKGKQHRASCKSKVLNPITKPLFMLHMDLFGPTFVSSLMHKKYCLVVTDDYSRFTWVFFLTTKDETSEILKNFIKEIENLVDKKVKIIRSDNGTEFKNKVMDDFCREKGIKREYSVARTPQQNGVAERRNRTLIEAARTMLADSKLPTTFWAEAVSTACYVQNRVLVVKPHNKTPYELFRGFKPALSFMRPFGCHVTILNTLDNLGKFDGKSDEGFFVGYSLSSKAFRWILKGTWAGNIELTSQISKELMEDCHFWWRKQMEEESLDETSEILKNFIKEIENLVDKKVKIIRSDNGTEFKNHVMDEFCREKRYKERIQCSKDTSTKWCTVRKNRTLIEAARTMLADSKLPTTFWAEAVSTACYVQNRVLVVKPHNKTPYELFRGKPRSVLSQHILSKDQDLSRWESMMIARFQDEWVIDDHQLHTATSKEYMGPIPNTEDVTEGGSRIDLGNLSHHLMQFLLLLILRILKGSFPLIIAIYEGKTHQDLHTCLFACFLSQEEPKRVSKALSDPAWVEAMQEELLQFKLQNVYAVPLFDMPKGQNAICTESGHTETRRMKGIVIYVDDIIFGSTKKELCEEFEKLMKDKFQMSSMGELTFFLGLQVQQKKKGIFISQDKYVHEILKKFNYTDVKSASTPTDLERPLNQISMFAVGACQGSKVFFSQNFRKLPSLSVKSIFRYLKGKPSLAMASPKQTAIGKDSSNPFMAGFHPIIDFITRCHIHYALTKKPEVCVSFIRQFWRSAEIVTDDDGSVKIHATIDGHSLSISEGSLRRHLKLDDQDGITSLPTTEIFAQLALMGYATNSDKLTFQKGAFSPQWRFLIHNILHCLSPKKTAWEQFSSNIAAAVICLATDRKFNFSRMIFDHMVSNISSPHKFLMYPRFIQLCLDMQRHKLQQHSRVYLVPSLTMKVFSNMKRITKGFSGQEVDLFPNMLDAAESSPSRSTSSPSPTPTSSPTPESTHTQPSPQPPTPQPSPTQPSPTHLGSEYHPPTPHDSPLHAVHSHGSDEGSLKLQELMNLINILSDRVGVLEADLTKTKQTYNAEGDSSKQGRKLSNEGFKDDEGVHEKASTETELFIQEITPTEVIHDQEEQWEKLVMKLVQLGKKKGYCLVRKFHISTKLSEVTFDTAWRNGYLLKKKGRQIKYKGKGIMTIKSQEEIQEDLSKKKSFAEGIRIRRTMHEEQRAANC
ncbi:putative ribonuclease H-like domain-containing protein [Tanacetum coccineum]